MARDWRVARSLDTLANEVNARWPGRSKVSDGTLGDPAHAARVSDHNPDAAGIVRARDVTEWDPGTPGVEADDVAEVIAETIRARRDLRVKYVIWRGRMFSSYATSSRRPWEWGPYAGPNGHFHHVHVSVVPDDRADSTTPWGIHPTDPEEFTMDAAAQAEFDKLNERLDRIENQVVDPKGRLAGMRSDLTEVWREVVYARSGGKGRIARMADDLATLVRKG